MPPDALAVDAADSVGILMYTIALSSFPQQPLAVADAAVLREMILGCKECVEDKVGLAQTGPAEAVLGDQSAANDLLAAVEGWIRSAAFRTEIVVVAGVGLVRVMVMMELESCRVLDGCMVAEEILDPDHHRSTEKLLP